MVSGGEVVSVSGGRVVAKVGGSVGISVVLGARNRKDNRPARTNMRKITRISRIFRVKSEDSFSVKIVCNILAYRGGRCKWDCDVCGRTNSFDRKLMGRTDSFTFTPFRSKLSIILITSRKGESYYRSEMLDLQYLFTIHYYLLPSKTPECGFSEK